MIWIWEVASGRCVKNILMDTFESMEGRLEAPYHMSYSTDGLVLHILGSKTSVSSEDQVTSYFNAQKLQAIPDVPQTVNFLGPTHPNDLFLYCFRGTACACTTGIHWCVYVGSLAILRSQSQMCCKLEWETQRGSSCQF